MRGLPRRSLPVLGALILANLAAWAWAVAVFRADPALLSTALLAWVFGLRHAVDADHIAAIDNVVRKLMQEGRRPELAGLWFSLGHSTVVVTASLGVVALAGAADSVLPAIGEVGGVIGGSISGFFLLAIAVVNLAILRRLWRQYRSGAEVPVAHAGHGVLTRLFRPVFGAVRRSWHMYPLGLLFGLGFDTATAVGLLGISAAQAADGLSPWAAPAQVMVFPALFTAGMALVDTADSLLMTGAYGWAFVNPRRKLRYNITITALSVLVALLIGGLEVLGLVGEHLAAGGAFWALVGRLNDGLGYAGFAVVGLFALCWAGSAMLGRGKGQARPVPAGR